MACNKDFDRFAVWGRPVNSTANLPLALNFCQPRKHHQPALHHPVIILGTYQLHHPCLISGTKMRVCPVRGRVASTTTGVSAMAQGLKLQAEPTGIQKMPRAHSIKLGCLPHNRGLSPFPSDFIPRHVPPLQVLATSRLHHRMHKSVFVPSVRQRCRGPCSITRL